MKNIYEDISIAELYERFLAVPAESLRAICHRLTQDLVLPEESNVLFFGIGTGRLELPLLNSIANGRGVKRVNVLAVDKSEPMLRKLVTKIKSEFNCKFDLSSTPFTVKVRETEVVFDIQHGDYSAADSLSSVNRKFDIVTAFFSLHVLDDWLTPLHNILNILKMNGQLIYAEESGDTKWIDNRYDNPERIGVAHADELLKLSFMFWRKFHQLRRKRVGKVWDQDLIASDMGALSFLLQKLDWMNSSTFEEKWLPETRFKFGDYLEWIDGKSIYHPVIADLSDSDLKKIKTVLESERFWDSVLRHVNTYIPREEGHRFHTWTKTHDFEQSRDDLESLFLETFLQNKSEHLLARILLLREPAEEIKDLSRNKKRAFRRLISNRSYLLYKFLFRTKSTIQIDFTIWEPKDTSLQGNYLDNLDIALNLPTREELDHYLSTYCVYTNIRPSEDKLFMTMIFQEQNYLNKIIIRRAVKSSCRIDLLPDGSVARININLPAVIPMLIDEALWGETLDALLPYIRATFADRHLLYNFDKIHNPFPSSDEASRFETKFKAIRDSLSGLEHLEEYHDLVSGFRTEVNNKIWKPEVRTALLENDVVDVFIKSAFYLELLGAGTKNPWKKISFLPGLFIKTPQNYKGFSCPILIEQEPSGIEYSKLLEPYVWNFSQQDGLIEYAGLAAKEGAEKGRLRGEASATIDALHTLKNDIDTPRGLINSYLLYGHDRKLLHDAVSSLRFIHGSAATAYIAAVGLRKTYFFDSDRRFFLEERLAIACRIALEEALRFSRIKRGYGGDLRIKINNHPIDLDSNEPLAEDNREGDPKIGDNWTDKWTRCDEEIYKIISEALGENFSKINFTLHLEGLIGAWGEMFFNSIKHGLEETDGNKTWRSLDVKFALASGLNESKGVKIIFSNQMSERAEKTERRGILLLKKFFEQLNAGQSESFGRDFITHSNTYKCWNYIFPERVLSKSESV